MNSTRGQRALRGLGFSMLGVGLISNEWLLGWLLSSDGSIQDPEDLFLIRAFQVVALAWGLVNVVFYRTPLAAKLNLSFIALSFASPLLVEVAIRIGISAGLPSVCRPGLYADALSDDAFWKLRHLWAPEVIPSKRASPKLVPDAQLGWAPVKSDTDPVGLIGGSLSESDNPILFFGDSFVEGNTENSDRIPQVLDSHVAERRVYNLGVSGYGVDQIFLRIQLTHDRWENPFLLIGILTTDLDRCLLRMRERPKPYFVTRGEGLSLEGAPLVLSNDEWIRQNPITIRSYLWAFLKMRYRLHRPGPWLELAYKRDEKKRLNRQLLSDIVTHCQQHNLPSCFVLFYEPAELEYVGWRERFILEQLRMLNADFVDTKPILVSSALQQSVAAKSYYQTDDHLNAAGNKVVARALAEFLRNKAK